MVEEVAEVMTHGSCPGVPHAPFLNRPSITYPRRASLPPSPGWLSLNPSKFQHYLAYLHVAANTPEAALGGVSGFLTNSEPVLTGGIHGHITHPSRQAGHTTDAPRIC